MRLPNVHLVMQVGKFDPQDIYVGEQVQLLSGQSATVLEVSIRALLSGLQILSQVVPETYYSVAFDDGTFCDNHDPEEVKYDEGVELTINTEVCSTSQTVCNEGLPPKLFPGACDVGGRLVHRALQRLQHSLVVQGRILEKLIQSKQ